MSKNTTTKASKGRLWSATAAMEMSKDCKIKIAKQGAPQCHVASYSQDYALFVRFRKLSAP